MAHTEAEIVQFLAKVPLFRGLKERQLKRIAGQMRERDYRAGEVIVEQAKMGIGLFIIGRGQAQVIRTHGDGTVVKLDELNVFDFFGELSLLDEEPRAASVVAVTDMICLVLSRLDMMDILKEEPDIAIEMLKTMANRFRRLLHQM